jgi:hypothetical protein
MCTSVQPSLKCCPVNHGKPPSSSRERAKQYGNTAALGEPEMAEEPKHLETIKWPKGCATCGEMVNTTGWLFNHTLYCEKHKPIGGGTTGGGSSNSSNASKEDAKLSYTPYADDGSRSPIIDGGAVALVHCDCGHGSYAPVMQRLSDWSTVTLCRDCDWLVNAQFKLKVLGVWRPVPKPTTEANT